MNPFRAYPRLRNLLKRSYFLVTSRSSYLGMHRVTDIVGPAGWPVNLLRPAVAELLTAFSSQYICADAYWMHTCLRLPFTLVALTHLKVLSIFGIIGISDARINCALPEITRLINTAPALQHVVLTSTVMSQAVDSLNLLQCNPTGARPRIELCITGDNIAGASFSPESILDALAGNNVLMGLVTRGSVILKSERAVALWDD